MKTTASPTRAPAAKSSTTSAPPSLQLQAKRTPLNEELEQSEHNTREFSRGLTGAGGAPAGDDGNSPSQNGSSTTPSLLRRNAGFGGGLKAPLLPPESFTPLAAGLQPKLKVGAPDDAFEQEADAMAEKVMNMPPAAAESTANSESNGPVDSKATTITTTAAAPGPAPIAGPMAATITRMPAPSRQPKPEGEEKEPEKEEEKSERIFTKLLSYPPGGPIRRKCTTCGTVMEREPLVQRSCKKCESEGANLQRKGLGRETPSVTPEQEGNINSIRNSGGAPLSPDTREFMESRFGSNFSSIRIHTDSRAEQAASAVNARAFALGPHIVFNRGEYQPGTGSGKKLLAHELTHTIQQGAAPAAPMAKLKPAEAGVQRTKSESPSLRRAPFKFDIFPRKEGELSPEEIKKAIDANQKSVRYDLNDAWNLFRASQRKDLFDQAVTEARSRELTPRFQIDQGYVRLVAAAQLRLGLPITGILDPKTRSEAARFRAGQDELDTTGSIQAILKSLENRRFASDRANIVHTLKVANSLGILGRVWQQLVPAVQEKFAQSNKLVIPWMYKELKEKREEFASIVLNVDEHNAIAGIRAAQIRDLEDPNQIVDKLTSMDTRVLEITLSIIQEQEYDPLLKPTSDDQLTAVYIFYTKVKGGGPALRLRRAFHEKGGLAAFYASVFTANEIHVLLRTERRIESDQGILMFFRSAPVKERATIMTRLDILTSAAPFKKNAGETLRSRLLPNSFRALQETPGIRLIGAPRVLSREEQEAVEADQRKIFKEIAAGVLRGGLLGIIKAGTQFVTALVTAPFEAIKLSWHLVMAYGFVHTDGLIGSESFEIVSDAIRGTEAFADKGDELVVAMLYEAYDRTLLDVDSIVGPGSTGARTAFWVSAITNFIVNLIFIIKAVKAATKSVIKRLIRLADSRRVRRALIKLRRAKQKREREKKRARAKDIDEPGTGGRLPSRGASRAEIDKRKAVQVKAGEHTVTLTKNGRVFICSTCDEGEAFLADHRRLTRRAGTEKQFEDLYRQLDKEIKNARAKGQTTDVDDIGELVVRIEQKFKIMKLDEGKFTGKLRRLKIDGEEVGETGSKDVFEFEEDPNVIVSFSKGGDNLNALRDELKLLTELEKRGLRVVPHDPRIRLIPHPTLKGNPLRHAIVTGRVPGKFVKDPAGMARAIASLRLDTFAKAQLERDLFQLLNVYETTPGLVDVQGIVTLKGRFFLLDPKGKAGDTLTIARIKQWIRILKEQ